MGSTLLRSFIKGCSWELISFTLTFTIIYALYRNFESALGVTIALTIFKIFLFFLHERVWKKIRWGKYHEHSLYMKKKNKDVRNKIFLPH